MKKEKEIEIKVQVEEIKSLLNFLEDKGKSKGNCKQTDEYFTPAHKDFTEAIPVREWFRLREEEKDKNNFQINYKNWHHSDTKEGLYCDEYEINVDDIENTRKIFKALGFKPIAKIKKDRTTWEYKDYEIAIDKVEELGDFIEIEFTGKDNENHEEIIKEMLEFIRGFELGKIKRVHMGYPFLLLFPQDVFTEEI